MACVVGRYRLGVGMELRSIGYVTVMFFAPVFYHSPDIFLHTFLFFSFFSFSVSSFYLSFFSVPLFYLGSFSFGKISRLVSATTRHGGFPGFPHLSR